VVLVAAVVELIHLVDGWLVLELQVKVILVEQVEVEESAPQVAVAVVPVLLDKILRPVQLEVKVEMVLSLQ
jgi:hypothetical protein